MSALQNYRNQILNGSVDVDIQIVLKLKYGLRKILCLHGGGQSADIFREQLGIQHLMQELQEYEFVFAETPENNGVWIRDAPNDKETGTNDINWANKSIEYLNEMIENDGPFYAILGYSQGAAMIAVYFSNVNIIPFEKVLLFNGYLPTVHRGLMQSINERTFDVKSLVFSGKNDVVFGPLSNELSQKFTSPTVITSDIAGHHLPFNNDPTFMQVITFMNT